MAENPVPSSKDLTAALQMALQEFDGVKVENMIQQGLDVSHFYIDPHKHHNALHELTLNYVTLQSNYKPEKLTIKFIDTLLVLTRNNLDINERDYKGQTALHLAASSPGHSEIIRILVSHGARVNQTDIGQQTPLHKAVLHGSVDDVVTLLRCSADPNLIDNVGHSPIHLAVKRKNNISIIKELIKCGGNVNLNHPDWNRQMQVATPLHTAARFGRTENAICLLKLTANPNIMDSSGQTPLHIAATHELSGKLCEALMQFGAKAELHDSVYGETPLQKAAKAGTFENVRALLLKGHSDPNSIDLQGNTALHKAAGSCKNLAVWHLLVSHGGKLNTSNSNGQSPIDVAQYEKNYNVLTLYRPIPLPVHI